MLRPIVANTAWNGREKCGKCKSNANSIVNMSKVSNSRNNADKRTLFKNVVKKELGMMRCPLVTSFVMQECGVHKQDSKHLQDFVDFSLRLSVGD